jgi:hypothetical protein
MTYTIRQHWAMGRPTSLWDVRDEAKRDTVCTCNGEVNARMLAVCLNTLSADQIANARIIALAEMAQQLQAAE